MRHRHLLLMIVLILGFSGLASNCRKKTQELPPPPAAAPAPAPTPAPEPVKEVTETFPKEPVRAEPIAEVGIDELNRQGVLKTVYFDYDKDDLDDGDRATLRANADWLKSHPTRVIRIEGHCDERGTIKYNLALGERRANSVREYLTSLGIDAPRMRIVSYGEERPVDPEHSEAAWSQNRRADFYIES